ncbi:MAG TPA: nitroreductase family protein [Candidatus Saccharimonadales bacterium]|nr:nitroreductase family protein [Candidatus Saccharimonadales bacterium]
MKKLKKLVKFLLSVPFIRKTYEFVNKVVLSIGSLNRITSVVYHWPAFFTFSREQYAVLSGRRNYYRNLSKQRRTHTELRRNTHRLEKGLLMRPRRPVFARDYIGETVEFYERAVNQYCGGQDSDDGSVDDGVIDQYELDWAHNVLQQYFDAVKKGGDKGVDRARKQFEATDELYNPGSQEKKVPYTRAKAARSKASYDELLNLSLQRRSVRWFLPKKVPRDLIDKALMVGRQSPTACNRMPYEFRIFDDPEMVKKVAGIPFGAAGYAHNIPTIIVVVGKLHSYFSPRDRHVIYVDASLAVMPFMLALETLGLSSSPINWPDFEPLERKMQKTLHLADDERVIMLIAVGYADPEGMVAFSQKKSLDVFRSYNDLGGS